MYSIAYGMCIFTEKGTMVLEWLLRFETALLDVYTQANYLLVTKA